jgi:hypothetical protein
MNHFPAFIDPGHRTVEELSHLTHGVKGESPQLFQFYAKGCNQMGGLLKWIHLQHIYAAKEVNGGPVKRIQNISDLIGFLALLFRSAQMLLPILLRPFLEEELNPHKLVVDRVQMPLVAMTFHVHHVATDTEDLLDLLPILFERIPKGVLNMRGLRETSARDKSRIGRSRLTALRKPLKVVRIVNDAARNGLARDP